MNAIAKNVPILKFEHALERRVRFALIGLCFVLCAAYVYLSAAAVLNVIAHKEAHSTLAHVNTSVAQLESEYFAVAELITEERALTLGFAPIAKKDFVNRDIRLGQAR